VTPEAQPRYIRIVHAMPGRSRFRLSWLRGERRTNQEEVTRLADALAALPGMREVRIDPYTGSVLCLHDVERAAADRAALVGHLVRLTGVETVLGEGQAPPATPPAPAHLAAGSVARGMVRLFKDLDDRVLAATDGKLDLGTLATLGFLATGAIGVASRRQLSAPPWFNLAWWGFRTFMSVERDLLDGDGGDPGDAG
jgi:hypothetical protein